MPNFGGGFCIQIQLIFSRARKATLHSLGDLKRAIKSIVEKQQILVVGDRSSMMTDWRQAGHRQCKLGQRWKLEPFFRFVSKDPLDRARFIIEADNEILTARDNQRVIRAVIGSGVAMEPVGRRRKEELVWIVSPGDHGSAGNSSQVPCLQKRSGEANFHDDRFIVGCGICFEEHPSLTGIDIVMEINNSIAAIVPQHGGSSIEIHSM